MRNDSKAALRSYLYMGFRAQFLTRVVGGSLLGMLPPPPDDLARPVVFFTPASVSSSPSLAEGIGLK